MKKNNTPYPDSRCCKRGAQCFLLTALSLTLPLTFQKESVDRQNYREDCAQTPKTSWGASIKVHTFLELPRKLKEKVDMQSKCCM